MERLLYFFQNYVWVPFVGGALALLVPYLWSEWRKRRKNKLDREIDEFRISGEWNSVFIEGKNIQTEVVHIKQIGRIVTATIQMGNREYNFQGEFKNQILVGTYESNSRTKD